MPLKNKSADDIIIGAVILAPKMKLIFSSLILLLLLPLLL